MTKQEFFQSGKVQLGQNTAVIQQPKLTKPHQYIFCSILQIFLPQFEKTKLQYTVTVTQDLTFDLLLSNAVYLRRDTIQGSVQLLLYVTDTL